ncbi:MAG: hypothetical protein H6934_06375 [Burkholderiaceae bacterium]|nr:hypothetical protein [Burkholderiaceae bacterium]
MAALNLGATRAPIPFVSTLHAGASPGVVIHVLRGEPLARRIAVANGGA